MVVFEPTQAVSKFQRCLEAADTVPVFVEDEIEAPAQGKIVAL